MTFPFALLPVIASLAVTGGVAHATAGKLAAAASPPYIVTVTPTTNLTDGLPITVTVTGTPGHPVGQIEARYCQSGVNYTSETVADAHGNCGFSPGQSAVTSSNQDASKTRYGDASGQGASLQMVAGTGTATLYNTFHLTCDSANPCPLVVEVWATPNTFSGAFVSSTLLTFAPAGSAVGCSGISNDVLQTAGSDRFLQSFEEWSKGACATPGGPGGGATPTSLVFQSEGTALASFASGSADLAYAAGGFGLPGLAPPTTDRQYVAVPLAINAVVVASSGGSSQAGYKGNFQGVPFPTVGVTADQVASIFGPGMLTTAQAGAMKTQNPTFPNGGNYIVYPGGFLKPMARATTDATTLFATTYFTKVAPQSWMSSTDAAHPASVPRGVVSAFAGDPNGPWENQFNNLAPYSSRPDLEKVALPVLGGASGPMWVLNDRATSMQLGLTVASLAKDTQSAYIDASPATMDAAVPTMTTQSDGTLVPDPVAADANAAAYPLTFVEYALAPLVPLADPSTCAPRTGSQDTLISWLNYLTGTAGQSSLAPGLEPLTPALQQQATTAIAKVGTGPACGTSPTDSTTTTVASSTTTTTSTPPRTTATAAGSIPPASGGSGGTPAANFGGVPGGNPTAGAPYSTGNGPVPLPVDTGTTTAVGGGTSPANQQLSTVKIPVFAGRRGASKVMPSLALLVLALLFGIVAFRSSGRPTSWMSRSFVTNALARLRHNRPSAAVEDWKP